MARGGKTGKSLQNVQQKITVASEAYVQLKVLSVETGRCDYAVMR
jgi:hypothetical protein